MGIGRVTNHKIFLLDTETQDLFSLRHQKNPIIQMEQIRFDHFLPGITMAADDVFSPLYQHYFSACNLEADSHLSYEWGIRLPRAENKWHVQARFFDRLKDFSGGIIVVIVLHVMGLRNPQA